MSEETFSRLLERAAGFSRGVRFVDRREGDTFFPYEKIYRRALEVSGGLQEMGVGPGDRVALVLPTSIDFYDGFFGSLLAGAVPVPLYPPFRLGRLEEYHARTGLMLRRCGARLLLTNRLLRRLLGRTLQQAGPGLVCAVMEEIPRRPGVRVERSPDELALIQFSSGTTMAPKPVRLTHRQILANVRALQEAILIAYPEGRDFTHVGVCWLPLYHDMGLVGGVLTALAHPGDLVLIPPEVFASRPAVWLRAISKYRGTVSPAPNFAYSLCAQRIRDQELAGVDLSSWRLAFNGSEPVTPRTLEAFLERFRAYGLREEALTPVYGLAEATLAVTCSDPLRRFGSCEFDREKLSRAGVAEPAPGGLELVSVGRALPDYQVRLADEEGEPVPEGRMGRVLVRGPSIMEGYHELPEATSAVLRDGWLDTGDTGFFHEGNLFLYGRSKDLVILRGRNYSAEEIEQALEGLSGLRTGCCAAVGIVPEGGDGETLVVFAERSRGASPQVDVQLVQAVRQRLAERLGIPADKVLVLEPGTLPRTSSGKIQRNETRQRFLSGTLTPPEPVTRWRIASEMFRSSLAFAHRRRNREP